MKRYESPSVPIDPEITAKLLRNFQESFLDGFIQSALHILAEAGITELPLSQFISLVERHCGALWCGTAEHIGELLIKHGWQQNGWMAIGDERTPRYVPGQSGD